MPSSILQSSEDSHISVMLNEVVQHLDPKDGDVIVDGTFGAGGHTEALLKKSDCRIYAIDRDPNVQVHVHRLVEKYGERVIFLEGCFGDMQNLLEKAGVHKVDGILLDIGVSSMQLDEAERGFSFQNDGPLDMRMSGQGQSAADIVNKMAEEDLANIIYKYGDERKSRRVAKAIINARAEEEITSTLRLVEIIKRAVGKYNDTINPATRTFQALRIVVNDELGELERALESAENILSEGGRLAVITFHSGEDKIVKSFFAERSGNLPNTSRYLPEVEADIRRSFKPYPRKAIAPSDDEVHKNIRARSAKLRVAMRVNIEGVSA